MTEKQGRNWSCACVTRSFRVEITRLMKRRGYTCTRSIHNAPSYPAARHDCDGKSRWWWTNRWSAQGLGIVASHSSSMLVRRLANFANPQQRDTYTYLWMMKIHGSMAKDRETLCTDTYSASYVTIHWSFSTFQVMYIRWFSFADITRLAKVSMFFN